MHAIPITRLDVFFRTQLPVVAPDFFNRITNIAFAPLQYLVGQKKYHHGVQGRIVIAPSNPSNYSSIIKKVNYVFAFILAVIFTPIGIATRYLSFLSPDVKEAYSIAFLSQLFVLERTPAAIKSACAFIVEKPELLKKLPQTALKNFLSHPDHEILTNAFLSQMHEKERTDLLKQLPPKVQASFLETYPDAIAYLLQIGSEYSKLMPVLTVSLIEAYNKEKPKKAALDEYLTEAIRSLEKLDKRLNGDRDGLESWLIEFSNNDPFYSLPITVAKQFENNKKVIARANPALWEKFISLRQSCNEKLSASGASLNEDEIKTNANQRLLSAFQANDAFFNTLKKHLDGGQTDIAGWLEDQKKDLNYHYPFYTHPHVLESMKKLGSQNLQPLFDLISTCQQKLEEKGFQSYTTEDPPLEYAPVNAVMDAVKQLENIVKIKQFIKTQTTEGKP